MSPKIVMQVGHRTLISAAAWTPDSRFLVTGAGDGALILWDTRGRVIDKVRLPAPADGVLGAVETLEVAADGRSARAVVPVFEKDFARLRAIAVAWRFGEARVSDPVAAPPPGRLVKMDAIERDFSRTSQPEDKAWPSSPDGRFDLKVKDGLLTLRPPGSARAAIALVGQAALSDFGLSFLAGNESDASIEAPSRAGEVDAANGLAMNMIAGEPGGGARSWSLSPDGRLSVFIDYLPISKGGVSGFDAYARVFDITSGVYRDPIKLAVDYDQARWLGSARLLVSASNTATPPAVLDLDGGRVPDLFPPLCFTAPVGEGDRLVGAGTANCSAPGCYPAADAPPNEGPTKADEAACAAALAKGPRQGLWVASRSGGVQPLDTTGLADADRPADADDAAIGSPSNIWLSRFEAIVVAPDGATAAAAHVVQGGAGRVGVWDLASGRRLALVNAAAPMAFSPDGHWLFASTGRGVTRFDAASGSATLTFTLGAQALAGWTLSPDGSRLLLVGAGGEARRFDPATGAADGPAFTGPGPDAGFDPGRPVIWSSADDGGRAAFDLGGVRLFTLYDLPGSRFFVVSPGGRYDSNLPADTRALRWLAPDAPFQSLAPQTFMRGFYEPGLVSRRLGCLAAGNCAAAFRPLPDLRDLDRVLPIVTITGARDRTGFAEIDVEAIEGVDETAANQRTRSGLHDIRLFRDGRLVARYPEPAPAPEGRSPEARRRDWSGETEVGEGEGGRTFRRTFRVALPTHAPGTPVTFTAYAFNDDRIKGETSPPVSLAAAASSRPRPRRAYVVAIGVNAYAMPGKSLRFAVNDAQAVAGSLTSIDGFEVVSIPLISDRGHDQATKADIHAVLSLLGGDAAEASADRGRLRAAGVDAARLAPATPDDVVILSFSGHGYADPEGAFYLLPSDAAQPDEAEAPTLSTLISSAEVTEWTRAVDAGDIAVIIDACHSAASVAAGGFKPGPMGDPGLGQLAFDKGLRILAATQGDDVAMEDAGLGQGLLTYALVHDGLGDAAHPGKARQDTAGGVRLDALLRYAVNRMPSLAEEVGAGRSAARTAQPMLVARVPTPAPHPHVQQPSLFDFTGEESPVRLEAPR